MTYYVEIYSKEGDCFTSDSVHRSKWQADHRCLELNHRGQFSRVVNGRGEICTR